MMERAESDAKIAHMKIRFPTRHFFLRNRTNELPDLFGKLALNGYQSARFIVRPVESFLGSAEGKWVIANPVLIHKVRKDFVNKKNFHDFALGVGDAVKHLRFLNAFISRKKFSTNSFKKSPKTDLLSCAATSKKHFHNRKTGRSWWMHKTKIGIRLKINCDSVLTFQKLIE